MQMRTKTWLLSAGAAVGALAGSLFLSNPEPVHAEVLHTHTSQITRVGVNVGNGDLYVQLATPVPSAWTTCATNYGYIKVDLDSVAYPDGVLAMLYTAVASDKEVSFVIGDGATSCHADSATFKSVYVVR